RVDNASYMYEFMNKYTAADKPAENVMSDNVDESALLAKHLNMSKLYLSMIEVPTEYKVTYQSGAGNLIDSIDYLEDVNGNYSLDYVFELTDNSEAKVDSIAYKVQLFIDTDADGRYDASEELDGLRVRSLDSGADVDVDKLETGVRYTVSRQLPDGYSGMVPWKLLVTKVSDDKTNVHTSEVGYTAVPSDGVTTINVLQINATGGLNLTNNTKFQALFKNVKEKMNYDIKITTITVREYLEAYDNFKPSKANATEKEKYTEFYNTYFQTGGEPYDMLILGFKDMYDDITSEGATRAIKMFIESGRSVLFSHDTTSFVNASKDDYNAGDYWGYYLNQYIRSIVGMDRFGITEDDLSFLKDDTKGDLTLASDADLTNDTEDDTYKSIIEELNKDIAYNYNKDRKTANVKVHGYSNISLVRNTANSDYRKNVVYETKQSNVNSVTQVNKGQITSYPYDLNVGDGLSKSVTSGSYQMINLDKMGVAETHSQYYQLDMQLDKTSDNKSDIVVWYTLADGMYDATPNDVRNNYYIYSVGNVMYTGMGHSDGLTWDEAKLFANTIIASYQAGKKDPTIAIVESEEDKATIQQYAYRTFDIEMDMVDNEDQEIYFYVNDNNIINGKKTINVHYYIEADGSEASAVAHAEGETTIDLEPIDSKNITQGADTVTSNKVYKLKLSADWVNKILGNKAKGELKIYIGAQTELDYDYERETENTSEVFASVTIKRREMFDLD
ncbi:MAG: DUF5057 domain-containing protein, partial [Dorea sp.]